MEKTCRTMNILRDFPVQTLRSDLLRWWCHAKRHFPWRETRDAYRVLVAEVLLHRTRAGQVVPLYQLFLERFPNIQALAKSTPDELLRLFRSAGLRWRWKLLHAMAVDMEARFNGQIPDDFVQLTSLPGVSHYIASAERCFAFGHPEAIMDTNTVRVTGRLFGLAITDSSRRRYTMACTLNQPAGTGGCTLNQPRGKGGCTLNQPKGAGCTLNQPHGQGGCTLNQPKDAGCTLNQPAGKGGCTLNNPTAKCTLNQPQGKGGCTLNMPEGK